MQAMINASDQYLRNLEFLTDLLEREDTSDRIKIINLMHSQLALLAIATRDIHGCDIEILDTNEIIKKGDSNE